MPFTTQVSLIGSGGQAPYTFSINAAQSTIPATISGNLLTVNATNLEPGIYQVVVIITDSLLNSNSEMIEIDVLDQNILSILNRNTTYQPTTLPFSSSITLQSVGGTGAITWSLLPNVTNLPGVTLSGTTITFTTTSFGIWSLGVRATDALNNTVTKVLEITLQSASAVSVVQGHALVTITPQNGDQGNHQFTLTVADSQASVVKATSSYTVNLADSPLNVMETAVDYFWGTGDPFSVIYPISGSLNGFNLGNTSPITAANGIVANVDPINNVVTFSGPPNVAYGNSEIYLPFVVLKSGNQVATITKEYTLVTHGGAANLGAMTCYARPYTVGQFVGLNPQRPYYNSPPIFKNNAYVVQVATGSSLPLGLSLDSTTGLVYGYVLGVLSTNSVLNYIDTAGVIQGTVTIVWDIVVSKFQLIDFIGSFQLQVNFTGSNYLLSTSSAPLTLASIHRGRLPNGLSLGVSSDGTQVVVSGAATEAGFFDIWFTATDANGQVAYFHKRLEIIYADPLVITTDVLNRLSTGVAFSQTLLAVGGVLPYTWSLIGGVLPTNFTLNSSSGLLSGTTPQTSYNSVLQFQVTDARGVTATTSLSFIVNNTLTITTSALPLINPGQYYQIQLTAIGGTPSYSWSLAAGSPNLPAGFTLSSGGLLFGATSVSSYIENVVIQVNDSASNTTSAAFALNVLPVTTMAIDMEDAGPIARGTAYHGTLSLLGNFVKPCVWSVSPDSPNPLPTGIILSTDQANQGITATLAGTTATKYTNYSVKIQCVDANGNTAYAFWIVNTDSTLTITTSTLPQGTQSGAYSTQLTANGVNTPFVWTVDGSSITSQAALSAIGINLSSAGLFYGTPTSTGAFSVTFRVTDSLGDFETATFTFNVVASTLTITNTLPFTNPVAGVAYSYQMIATGGNPGYSWFISPSSAVKLPTGLSLNSSTGLISGTTFQTGTFIVTIRVVDSIGVYKEITNTFSVSVSTKLYTGIDYTNNTITGNLGITAQGDVTSINPNPDLAFFIVASNCVSTNTNGLALTLPAGYSYSITSFASGICYFKLSGPFGSAVTPPVFPNITSVAFPITVHDSGVSVSATFAFGVFTEPTLGIFQSNSAGTGNSITLMEGVAGSVYATNNSGNNEYIITGYSTVPVTQVPNVVGFTAGNNATNGVVLIEVNNNPTYNVAIAYTGGGIPSNVANTICTLTSKDVAWYSSIRGTSDLFQYTGGTSGGNSSNFVINWLTNPGVASVSPSSISGNGAQYNITVTLSQPLTPNQAGLIPNFTFTGGVSTLSVTAIISNGFTTGWTVKVQSPTITSGNITVNVNMSTSQTLTFLQSSGLIQTVTYPYPHLQGTVGTFTLISETKSLKTSSYPAGTSPAIGLYNLSYETTLLDDSGVTINKWDVSSLLTPNNGTISTGPPYSWSKVIYYINGLGIGNGPGGSVDLSGLTVNMWLGAHVINNGSDSIVVAIGFLAQSGWTWVGPAQSFVMNNNGSHGTGISQAVPTGIVSGSNVANGNGIGATTGGTFDPSQVAGIVFYVQPYVKLIGNGAGANGGLFVGAPSSSFPYWKYSS